MKKNLLFIIPSLSAGGGEKSLINLLSQIDYELYNVDLFLFNHEGIFMKYIPKEVRVIPNQELYALFTLPLYKSLLKLLNRKQFKLISKRIFFTLRLRANINTAQKEQKTWKYVAQSLKPLDKKYDVAISFLEKSSTYFCVDKVRAEKKVAWVHNDYDKLGMDPDFDKHYFHKISDIFTVSEECAIVLKKRFPTEKEKIHVMYNIISPKVIANLADQQITTDIYENNSNQITILSIGRLHYQKGFEMAIEACHKLVLKGHNIKWYVIGEGEERLKLERLINKKKLEENFILLGLKSNPYPFIKHCDLYVQTSRFEGKSIAIDEAKILLKPIIITNYSTAKDQINDYINGLIVEMNSNAIADGIELLYLDPKLKEKFIFNLTKEELGTENEIKKLYQFL